MRIRDLLLAVPILIALHLSGCGGGGGGGGAATQAILTVTTDWSKHSQANGGLSERISILDANGIVQTSAIVTQSAGTVQTTALTALPVGRYHFLGQLYSGQNLAGTQVGQLDEWIDLNTDKTNLIAVGAAPAKIVVSPATSSIKVQQSQQFFANGIDQTQRSVYLPTGNFTWTALGNVVNVDANGIAIGTAPGNGSVRATYTPTGQLGAATISVSPISVTTSKWTIMVYLNAANDLDSFAIPNFVQMQKAAQNPNVRILVQFKQAFIPGESENPSFVGTRRYLVKADTTSSTVTSTLVQDMGTGVDMGSATTLNNFVKWSQHYYPADRYCLVVWNHGNGWRSRALSNRGPTRGVSYDDDSGNHIDTWQLQAALNVGKPLDIVAWDASLMQMAEVAGELKTVAKYIVGSEESPPGSGYPYDLIFAKFRDNPDKDTPTLCRSFVDGMIQYYTVAGTHITQSVLDVSQLSNLGTAIDGLAGALIGNAGLLGTIVPSIRTQAQGYPPADPVRLYRDLYDVCRLLNANAGTPTEVKAAASNVQSAIASSVLYEKHSTDSSNSHGISIDFSDSTSFAPVSSDYSNLNLAQTTRWDSWLQAAP